jgi:hypothetical protein
MDVVPVIAIPLAVIAGVGWVISAVRTMIVQHHAERAAQSQRAQIEQTQHAHTLELERLRQDHALEVERVRAALVVQTIERQAALTQVHRMRIEVTAELYRRLARLQRYLDSPAEHDHSRNGHATDPGAVAEASHAFLDYFDDHRVWLDPATADELEILERKVRHAWSFFAGWTTLDPTLNAAQLVEKRPLAWRSAWITLTDEVPAVRRNMEARMRALTDAPQGTAAPNGLMQAPDAAPGAELSSPEPAATSATTKEDGRGS